MASTPLSWEATPSPNCLNSSITTLTLDFTSSPFLPLPAAAPRPVLKERSRAVSASPKARGAYTRRSPIMQGGLTSDEPFFGRRGS
jgi:hypothetical protein